MSGRLHSIYPWLLLVALGALAYANSLHGPFVFDDVDAIADNPHIRSLWPLGSALQAPAGSGASGRPLVALSLALNYAAGGLEPLGYHLFNIAAHLLCGLLLFALVRGTLARPASAPARRARAGTLALAMAALWIVHPLTTAALDHVIYRNEILAGLFLLGTLECLRRSAAAGHPRRWQAGAVVACAAGMASKETAYAIPILATLYDVLFLSGGARAAWRARGKLHLALGATWVLLALCIATADRGASVTTRYADVTRLDYARTQLGVVAHYLRLAAWPQPLVLDYDWPIAHRWAEVALPALFLASLVAAALAALRRRSGVSFVAVAFFLLLAPSSSIVPLTGAVAAEHRMYLPLASVVIVVVLGLSRLLARAAPAPRPRAALGAALVLLALGALGATTWRRNADYASSVRIWQDTAAKRPRNPRAHGNLGTALVRAGQPAAAIAPLETALQLAPEYPAARVALVGARRAAGAAALGRGDTAAALVHLRRAVALAPGDALVLNDLAWVQATCAEDSLRDAAAALTLAERAAQFDAGRDASILDTLAAAYAANGQFDAAVRTAERARTLAAQAGQAELADRIAARSALYARGAPYRAAAPVR